MSVATLPPPTSRATLPPRLLTVADLDALPTQLPTGPVHLELHDGRLVVLDLPSYEHGGVEAQITRQLMNQGDDGGHGKTRCGEVRVIIRRDPDTVFGADALFVAKSQLPIKKSKEGYLETIPALIVEIRSRSNSIKELEDKAAEYIAAGTKVVWIPDPQRQIVSEHRPDQPVKEYTINDVLMVEDMIPGFRYSVRDLFAD